MPSAGPRRSFVTTRGLVVFALLLSVGVAQAIGFFSSALGMPESAASALALTLIAAVLWVSEAIPLYSTSLVVLFGALVWIAPLLGDEVTKTTFLSPFFSPVILLFFGGFVIARGLGKYGWDETLARFVLRKTGGRPTWVLLGLMGATAFLSMWMSNTATTAMMLGLTAPLLERVPRGAPFERALLVCVPFSANLGGLGTPVGTPPSAIVISHLQRHGIAVDFLSWMAWMLPLVALGLGLLWLLVALLFRVDQGGLLDDHSKASANAEAQGAESSQPLLRTSKLAVFALFVVLLTAFLWLIERALPLGSAEIALVPALLLFGARALDVDDFRALPWDVLILIGGGMCLGVVIDVSGLASWLVSLLPRALSPFALLLVFGGAALFLTNLMSNAAAASLVTPLVFTMATLSSQSADPQAGFMPALLVAACASFAMVLPISTPPNAMAFATGRLAASDMLRVGLPLTVGAGLIALFAAKVYWPLFLK